jgi:hypothetical protein
MLESRDTTFLARSLRGSTKPYALLKCTTLCLLTHKKSCTFYLPPSLYPPEKSRFRTPIPLVAPPQFHRLF